LVHEYRDRVYIRKDIILRLSEYRELNQTKLISYCGLNNVKHRGIIDEYSAIKGGLSAFGGLYYLCIYVALLPAV
jgi:predicted transcriptional regulator